MFEIVIFISSNYINVKQSSVHNSSLITSHIDVNIISTHNYMARQASMVRVVTAHKLLYLIISTHNYMAGPASMVRVVTAHKLLYLTITLPTTNHSLSSL